ncbi:N-6 DNA methylase [Patescibacteria group bacterium]|nr:N-6 DNA methylase [Patescibacteria group bacterium]
MQTYAFLLGTHPILSLAELMSFLDNQKIAHGKLVLFDSIAIIDIKKVPEEIAKLQNELGGIIKIFAITNQFSGKIFEIEKILTPEILLKDFFVQKSKKINFGISVYSDPDPTYAELNWLTNFAHGIKKKLKDEYSIRYVEDRGWHLSSVQVERNRLIDTGAEIALIRNGPDFYLGKTLTVQDYRSYSQRDWDKPSPDAKSGMLPPKLAQMMINLTRDKKTKAVYDPFCGSGIVLQEAMMLGLKIYGSDISSEAVENTINNLEWLSKLKKISAGKINLRIKEADATKNDWKILDTSATVIVAEPYLGPPLRMTPFAPQAQTILKELSQLYLGFFKNLKRNFPHVQKVGMVFPVIRSRDGLKYLNILDEVAATGYTRKVILPPEVTKKDAGVSPRGGFLYSRPDQLVLREIFVFERK